VQKYTQQSVVVVAVVVVVVVVVVVNESYDPECAVYLVSVQQRSDCPVLVWNSVQGEHLVNGF